MSTQEQDTERRRLPIGTLVVGLLLVAAGLLWLLEALDVADIPWDALLPAGLIVVGAGLIVAARTHTHGGLITVGIVLTILTAASSAADIRLEGGIGDRTYAPRSAADLEDDYSLAIGQLEVDLTGVRLPTGTTTINISVGMGELLVEVPEGVAIDVSAELAAGDANIIDVEDSGVAVEAAFTDDGYESAATRLSLDLSVGLGDMVVSR
jgi:hypothetical protein